MSRQHFLLVLLLAAPLAGVWITAQRDDSAAARAAEIDLQAGTAGIEIAGLKDTLEKGLKARQPSEFHFIGHVVEMVENNHLPYRLVYISFKYARHKRPHFPFPYFEESLRRLAAAEGITI